MESWQSVCERKAEKLSFRTALLSENVEWLASI